MWRRARARRRDDARRAPLLYEPRADILYLLPGSHDFDMQVWTPGRFWSNRPQTTLSVSGEVEACHVYVPVGRHREGEAGWAGLVDMGGDAAGLAGRLQRRVLGALQTG